MRTRLLGVVAIVFLGCPAKPPAQMPTPSGRCEVDLAAFGAFSSVGTGAKAKVIEADAERVGGPFAQGASGDVVLENSAVRFVIQRPGREISPTPYGGVIVDGDIVREAGQPGRDAFGKLGLFYAFGRTAKVTQLDILDDGSRGGYAVVAATGRDALLDYVDVTQVVSDFLGGSASLQADPNQPLPLLITTYYVLSPGEKRVRLLTAFCNEGKINVAMQVGDLSDMGGALEFFNPASCTRGMGAKGCQVDPSPWFGYQGDDVAYGYRSYQFGNPRIPAQNALLAVTGVIAAVAEGKDQSGLLTWVDADARSRPGTFGIQAGQQRLFLRDFVVGRDLSQISNEFLAIDGTPRSRLQVSVMNGSQSAAQARVSVSTADGTPVTVAVTDAMGRASVDVSPGDYLLQAAVLGHGLVAPTAVTAPGSGNTPVSLNVGGAFALNVRVADPFGRPLPARVVVTCPGGTCPASTESYRKQFDLEVLPSNVAQVAFAGANGQARLLLPDGRYELFVSRGPEFSGWPEGFPTRGQPVDASTGTVNAVLAQVVDTTGFASTDLHVHALNSADSAVPLALRAASFAAEGVDIMVSTDHDAIVDYAPSLRELGLDQWHTSLVGCEVTPFNYGHHNAFPLTVGEGRIGGAFDWANGEDNALRLGQLYERLKARFPSALIQVNHPRGGLGGAFTAMEIETATGRTTAPPGRFRMDASPEATSTDTKLFSPGFDAIEVMNGFTARPEVLNDWMTFLSRGLVRVGTAVSDTHTAQTATVGYGRTWIDFGGEGLAQVTPERFAQRLKEGRAIGSSGPFVRFSAQRLDASGETTGPVLGLGQTLSVPAGEKVRLIADIQAPEWMQFDRLELYTHASGRQAAPKQANTEWPSNRIAQQVTLDPTMLPLEPVSGLNGFSARRVHIRQVWDVQPSADSWFVVMVRSTNATRPVFPLGWETVTCRAGVCTASESRVEAFTNPIFVDADGSGAYDTFPLRQGLSSPPAPGPARQYSEAERLERFFEALGHGEIH